MVGASDGMLEMMIQSYVESHLSLAIWAGHMLREVDSK